MLFTCPDCGMTSQHPVDATEGYCGACRDFTGVLGGMRILTDPSMPPDEIRFTDDTGRTLGRIINVATNGDGAPLQ